MLNCYDVARYFLSKCSPDSGDLISNLKLQKLMYYAQGYYLAVFGKPLFNEEIQAWRHGPVVVDLYHRYKQYGNGALPYDESIDFHQFSRRQTEFLDRIYTEFGQFSAWKLRDMTHDEEPWIKSYESGRNCLISVELMFAFFSHQHNRTMFAPSEINFDLERMKERVEDKGVLMPNLGSFEEFQKWIAQ